MDLLSWRFTEEFTSCESVQMRSELERIIIIIKANDKILSWFYALHLVWLAASSQNIEKHVFKFLLIFFLFLEISVNFLFNPLAIRFALILLYWVNFRTDQTIREVRSKDLQLCGKKESCWFYFGLSQVLSASIYSKLPAQCLSIVFTTLQRFDPLVSFQQIFDYCNTVGFLRNVFN